MPPRTVRSTQAGFSSTPASIAPSVTPTPSPAPEDHSRQSDEYLTPAPPTPIHRAAHRAEGPQALHLPEVPMATAEEVERLSEIVARLQTRLGEYDPSTPIRHDRHAIFEREPSYREASYAPTHLSSSPNKPKLKASDLPKFYGKDNEDVDQSSMD